MIRKWSRFRVRQIRWHPHDGLVTLAGVWPIVTTPFDDRGELDLAGLTRVVHHIADGGAHGLVYPAIASEFQVLSNDERRKAVEHVLGIAKGRLPVIVGFSSSIEAIPPAPLARHAEESGAAAVMLMPPAAMRSGLQAICDPPPRLRRTAHCRWCCRMRQHRSDLD